MNRLFYLNHTPINFHFTKNSKDFVVNEVPLYPFSGEGEHLVIEVRKKDMTTWDMIKALSAHTGVKERDFGYAGLKDKDGMTTQYLSLPKKHQEKLETFTHPKIKILSQTYHNNKIKIGHLKGNRFFIRLKKVSPADATKIKKVIKTIRTQGFPNYFGYQRFGREGDNFDYARRMLQGERKERNKKKRKFFISAYQSHLFNLWLSKRVEISKLFEAFEPNELNTLLNFPKESIKQLKTQPHFFKMLPGDLLHHYPHGKLFLCDDLESESQRFSKKDITITGLLPGHRTKLATGIASNFERDITTEADPFIDQMTGSRRFAWIWAEDLEASYKSDEAWMELHFTLPKGSYATVLLEEITHSPSN